MVEKLGLGFVAHFHGGHAAQGTFGLALEPLKGQARHVDAPGRWRVEHGLVVGHGLVVEGRGADLQRMAQQVIAHNHNGQARRANVLLCAAKGQAHAAPVQRAGGDVGRKIDHQRGIAAQRLQVGQLLKLHAMNGFVAAQVHVLRILAQRPAGGIGHAGEVGCSAAGSQAVAGVLARFFVRFLAPAACHHKIDRTALGQVQRHDGVLGQATTLHEQDVKVTGHGQQFAQIGFCGFVDADELFAAMAHLHHAHARAAPVEHFIGSLVQDFFGDCGGASRKIERAAHGVQSNHVPAQPCAANSILDTSLAWPCSAAGTVHNQAPRIQCNV